MIADIYFKGQQLCFLMDVSSLHVDGLTNGIKNFDWLLQSIDALSVQCSGVQYREDHPS